MIADTTIPNDITYQVNRIIQRFSCIIDTHSFPISIITLAHTTTIGHIGIIPTEVGSYQHLIGIDMSDFELKTYIVATLATIFIISPQVINIITFQGKLYSTVTLSTPIRNK